MPISYTVWVKNRVGHIEPIPAASPAWITTSEAAREDARRWVVERSIPAHSLTIEDESGAVLEEWRWRRNKWKPADA